MASQYATQAMALGQQAYINFKNKKTLVMSVGAILLLAFASMVMSSYTADHIKRSSCDMSKDTKLHDAYKWSTGAAVLQALVSLSMVYILVKVGGKPKL
jgi:hypothetical protein